MENAAAREAGGDARLTPMVRTGTPSAPPSDAGPSRAKAASLGDDVVASTPRASMVAAAEMRSEVRTPSASIAPPQRTPTPTISVPHRP
jgi:hypothetical protein